MCENGVEYLRSHPDQVRVFQCPSGPIFPGLLKIADEEANDGKWCLIGDFIYMQVQLLISLAA